MPLTEQGGAKCYDTGTWAAVPENNSSINTLAYTHFVGKPPILNRQTHDIQPANCWYELSARLTSV